MLASAKENNEATKAVKRSKAIYILDSIKYDLKALDEQLALDLTEEDLGTETNKTFYT